MTRFNHTKNTAILVAHITQDPVECGDVVRTEIVTEEIVNRKCLQSHNFIEAREPHHKKTLLECKAGDPVEIIGHLETTNKITQVVIDHIEQVRRKEL